VDLEALKNRAHDPVSKMKSLNERPTIKPLQPMSHFFWLSRSPIRGVCGRITMMTGLKRAIAEKKTPVQSPAFRKRSDLLASRPPPPGNQIFR